MQYKNIIKIFTALLFGAMIVSCSKEDNSTPDGELVAPEFRVGITTRAHDGQWDPNDDIGLSMISQESGRIVEDIYNYDYYTPTGGGLFVARNQGKTIYFPHDGSLVLFKGYYPYRSALSEDMTFPIDVLNQTNLPSIDLMTADHLAGFSKVDRVVHLNFNHRLTKIIFRLAREVGQEAIDLGSLSVSIDGMNTHGVYNLMQERLQVEENTVERLTFPVRDDASERYGIVLPREAGAGITFSFTSTDGKAYTASMPDDLELEAGYQYTFYITLRETEASVSAEITPWIDGPTTYYDALQIGGGVINNDGAIAGDEMEVYLEGDSGFELLSTFTYDGTSTWTADPIVYWEEIPADPARLRASLVREPALNDKQMPDVLVSEEIGVPQNRSAHFELNRAATKLFVELQSSTFTPTQLESALIYLPGYKTGGEVVDGAYVPGPADQREDIPVDRTDPDIGVAVINPQDVSPNGAVVRISIDGRDYTAYAGTNGMSYEAGVANRLVITVNEQIVTVSARVVDWKEGTPSYLSVLEIGTPAGASENVSVGTQMTVFTEDENNNSLPSYVFTYQSDGVWRTSPAIYWDQLPGDGPYTMRSWIIENSAAANATQLPDYLISEEIIVDKYDGANFTLTHAATQVVVMLSSSTFSAAQLASATVTLPDYLGGGSFADGRFIPGSTTLDILPEKDASGAWTALIQPQVIPNGETIVKITIPTTGGSSNTYEAAATADFTYNAGEIMRITVHVDENILTVSAKAVEWTEATADLNVVYPIVDPQDSEGIRDGERMDIYYKDTNNTDQVATYTYSTSSGQWSSTSPIFWDDVYSNSQMLATLYRQETAYNATQMADHMVLSSPVTVSSSSTNVNFDFIHPASRVIVAIEGGDEFTAADIANMTITLPGYIRGGSVTRGVYSAGNTTGTITVQQNVGDNGDQAIAIIDPQTIPTGETVVQIRNGANEIYSATYDAPIIFAAGQSTLLRITLRKSGISISATATDWQDQTPINLIPTSIEIGNMLGDTDDFFREKAIYLYKWGTGYWADSYTYLPGQNGYTWSGTPRYWDDQIMPFNVTAVYYPLEESTPPISNNTSSFPWTVPENQSTGYAQYDILTSYLQTSVPANLNFNFAHALSKVTIVLTSDEFTVPEMQAAQVLLNNLIIDGNISLPLGTASAAVGATPKTVTPLTETAGVQYSAMAMPQTLAAGTELVTVTLPQYPNTPFIGELSNSLTLVSGQNHVITLMLRRTSIDLSATVKDWGIGQTGEIIIQ